MNLDRAAGPVWVLWGAAAMHMDTTMLMPLRPRDAVANAGADCSS